MSKICPKCHGESENDDNFCILCGMSLTEEESQQEQSNEARTRESEWFHEKRQAFVTETKSTVHEILPILKTPVTEIQNIVSGNRVAVSIEFIAAKAAIALILTLVVMANILAQYVKIPYFKISLLIILITAGADFLESLLLKVFTRLFNGVTDFKAMAATVGVKALYECIIFIGVGVFCFISIKFAFIVYLICACILPYIHYSGYQAVTQVSADKKPYIFFMVKVCMFIILYIVVYLMGKDIIISMIRAGMSYIY